MRLTGNMERERERERERAREREREETCNTDPRVRIVSGLSQALNF